MKFHIAFDMTPPLMNGKSFPKTAYCGREYEHGERFFVPGKDIVEMNSGWVILTGEPIEEACLSCLHRFESGVEVPANV